MEGQPSDPGDRDVQISISRAEEIRFWCNRFGCTAAELGNAIGQVGYSAERVRALSRRAERSNRTKVDGRHGPTGEAGRGERPALC